jgi:soluble lytic murein transglycosylase
LIIPLILITLGTIHPDVGNNLIHSIVQKEFLGTITEQRIVSEAIITAANKYNFDPLFIIAVIKTESNWDLEAQSPTGALGLMQLVTITWKDQIKRSRFTQLRIFNPAHNIHVGTAYLSYLHKTFRRIESVALAYNQGPGVANQYLQNNIELTSEGFQYSPKLVSFYRNYLRKYNFDPEKYYISWDHPKMFYEGFKGLGFTCSIRSYFDLIEKTIHITPKVERGIVLYVLDLQNGHGNSIKRNYPEGKLPIQKDLGTKDFADRPKKILARPTRMC